MLKKIATLLLFPIATYGQIGVNTNSPNGLLDIQGTSNNVVFSSKGNMGIGTTSPSTKVDIISPSSKASFRLRDGNEGENMVLSSNDLGTGTWLEPQNPLIVEGSVPNNVVNNPVQVFNDASILTWAGYTGIYITLKPGNWQISFGVKIEAMGNIPNPRTVFGSFASAFFSLNANTATVLTDKTAAQYLTPIKSIIIDAENNALNKAQFSGWGSIPIKILGSSPITLYLYIFLQNTTYSSSQGNTIVSYGSTDFAGKVSYIYATPIHIIE